MDDIRNRDLSGIPDEDLSPAEKRELQRRFNEFLTAIGGTLKKAKPKKKAVKWDPAVHGRKH